jgi:hypothetical protein
LLNELDLPSAPGRGEAIAALLRTETISAALPLEPVSTCAYDPTSLRKIAVHLNRNPNSFYRIVNNDFNYWSTPRPMKEGPEVRSVTSTDEVPRQ